jgi:hypothetical protein
MTIRVWLTLACAVLFLLPTSGSGGQEPPTKPFSITITPVKSRVVSGAPVEIKVVLKNTSDQDVWAGSMFDGSIDASYEYDVRDSAGNSAPVRKRNKVVETRSFIMSPPLKPGLSKEETTNLSIWFEMELPGEYTIQLSRRLNGGADDPAVKSNVVSVIVVPHG